MVYFLKQILPKEEEKGETDIAGETAENEPSTVRGSATDLHTSYPHVSINEQIRRLERQPAHGVVAEALVRRPVEALLDVREERLRAGVEGRRPAQRREGPEEVPGALPHAGLRVRALGDEIDCARFSGRRLQLAREACDILELSKSALASRATAY